MERHELTLVILAAGLGSRFGGDKQLAALGPQGQTMLEFSLMSAYKAGFRQSVLVIRKELESQLTEKLQNTLPQDFSYQFCYQSIDDLPVEINTEHRLKPWGTAHALYAARNHVHSAMAVINADDYYGDSAFELLAQGLTENNNDWMMVAYPLSLTLSEHGGVNRGVCQVDNGQLVNVNEWTNIHYQTYEQQLVGLHNGTLEKLSSDTLVSMTCWGFYPNIFTQLTQALTLFVKDFAMDAKKECFLPDVVQQAIGKGQQLNVAIAKDNWLGVTYLEDAAWVKTKLALAHGAS